MIEKVNNRLGFGKRNIRKTEVHALMSANYKRAIPIIEMAHKGIISSKAGASGKLNATGLSAGKKYEAKYGTEGVELAKETSFLMSDMARRGGADIYTRRANKGLEQAEIIGIRKKDPIAIISTVGKIVQGAIEPKAALHDIKESDKKFGPSKVTKALATYLETKIPKDPKPKAQGVFHVVARKMAEILPALA